MLDGIKIELNVNTLSWYVDITIAAIVFIFLSLIYKNTEYINYGFITFAYGVIAQIFDMSFNNIYKTGTDVMEKRKKILLFILQVILIMIWLYSIIKL